MSQEKRINPFKGLYSYEEEDKDIFFGRDNLSKELFNLVTLNGLTLVFGKSGIGKTSLLNAGLFPLLREANFLPVRLRLDYSSSGSDLLDQIKQELQKELKEKGIIERDKGGAELASPFGKEETLWEYFHRVDHVTGDGNPVTPVLVFDQFEELFTLGKEHPQRELLIDALSDLIEDQIPAAVKERILKREGVFHYLRSQVAVRVVFGLREDYLPHMNALKTRIPSIHRVMFRVIHLNGIQACEVMDKSGAFTHEGIKQDILRQFDPVDLEPGQTVVPEKLEVEPALLSLLCYQVFEQGVETLSVKDKDVMLSEFYDRVLSQLPRGNELALWIEDHLLTEGGFRTPFYLERSMELRKSVEAAIDQKLLRKLHIGEKEHVEIIHDVLAPVISERRNRRLEQKKRLEMEREWRRKRVITRIISVACVIAIALTIVAFIQKDRADEQYRNSLVLRLASESSLALITDNVKAIRLAEAAYKIGGPHPAPAVMRALSEAAYSTREHPFYTADFKGHTDWISSAAFSPGGQRILTTSSDKTAKLWDLKGHLLTDFRGHKKTVMSAVFSPDGKQVLTASLDGTAKLWDLNGHLLADLKGHKGPVISAVFSPDGQQILTASQDRTAKLWDVNGKLLADLKGHTNIVINAAFSPDGRRILTSSWDQTAKLFDLNGHLLTNFKGHKSFLNHAVFSPDGEQILTASWDFTVKLWDLNGHLLTDLKGYENIIHNAVFSPDGKQILTTSAETAKLWDLKGHLLTDFKGHTGAVRDAVFSPDGKQILTASSDHNAKLWDLNGQLLTEFRGHRYAVTSAVFSPDGQRILTTSMDKTAKLWNLKVDLLTNLKGHRGKINSAVFSPNGKYILTASWDHTAKLWDVKGNLLTDFKGLKDRVNSAEFSPDGRLIITLSFNKTIYIWDLKGHRLKNIKWWWHIRDGVIRTVFSPNDKYILTASWDNTAKLWDLNGQLLADLKGHTDRVNSVAFSPDGKKVVTASSDGIAILWPTPKGIMDWLKTAPIPKLTQQEKEELGIADFKLD
ncbi:MAG: eIF2A-related protein [Candidatus Omnitrophota bacterium]